MEIHSEQWPSLHTNSNAYLRPYNGSIFEVHEHYKNVFPEPEFDKINNDDINLNRSVSSSSSPLVWLKSSFGFN